MTVSYRRASLAIDIIFVVSVAPVELDPASNGALLATWHTQAAGPHSGRVAMIPSDLPLVFPSIEVKDPTYQAMRDRRRLVGPQ
jgi:hypothetical protein